MPGEKKKSISLYKFALLNNASKYKFRPLISNFTDSVTDIDIEDEDYVDYFEFTDPPDYNDLLFFCDVERQNNFVEIFRSLE